MARVDMFVVGGEQEARSRNVNTQTSLNWFPQIEGTHAGNPLTLYPTPGLKPFFKSGGGGIRSNGILWNNKGYFVSGSDVVEIDEFDNITVVGSILTVSGRVSMVAGRSMLAIVDGKDGWTYDGTNFLQITNADFPNPAPNYITWLKDIFLIPSNSTTDGGQFQISALDDATNWTPFTFASAESLPDDLIRPETLHGYLYLFGDRTTEVWYANGNADFPFEVYQNGTMDWGIEAKDSIGKADTALFWLGKNTEGNALVLSVRGTTATIISNRDIEWQINQLSRIDDAEGYCYRDAGHTFYVLTFPEAGKTYVYDIATQMWHQRASWKLGRYRTGGYLFFNNKHIVGDFLTNQFYTFDNDTFTDNGDPIERMRQTPLFEDNQKRMFWNRFEVVFESGVGLDNALSTAVGFDPQVMLRFSDNNGYTWSNELTRSIGKSGFYNFRSVWNRLGSSYGRVYELRITDPVKAVLIEAFADVTKAEYT